MANHSKLMDTLGALVAKGQSVADLAVAEGVTKQAIWRRLYRARKSGKQIPNLRWPKYDARTFTLQHYD